MLHTIAIKVTADDLHGDVKYFRCSFTSKCIPGYVRLYIVLVQIRIYYFVLISFKNLNLFQSYIYRLKKIWIFRSEEHEDGCLFEEMVGFW